MTLVKVSKNASGDIELTFENGSGTVNTKFDAAVFAILFSTLREVELDASLGLPDWKKFTIEELRYGTNAKMMVGFDRRPWLAQGSNGGSYSDLGHHQTTWETNPTKATGLHAILRTTRAATGVPTSTPKTFRRRRSPSHGVLPETALL